MSKFYRDHKRIINAVWLMLLPIIACLINTLSHGKGICDVFPSASEWNDELFYFKQVQCMVADGIPQGFFGSFFRRMESAVACVVGFIWQNIRFFISFDDSGQYSAVIVRHVPVRNICETFVKE